MAVRPASPAPSAAAIESEHLVDLAAILDPRVHVAIWRRPIDARIVALLERADCSFDGHERLVARVDDDRLDARLSHLVPRAARRADPDGAAALATDVRGIVQAFAELVAADELLVSLEDPEARTCPRFHVDRVGIRLLVTYVGPGTEWLAHEHVERRWLGDAGHGRLDEETGLMRTGARVQQVPAFAVVLLKGEAWPGAHDFGAVHRSPDPAGQRRVLLRVDMPSRHIPSRRLGPRAKRSR